ncbi:MAG: RICIN domain-containing protein [Deltaproteobacteria bacterium]|nr:RICIN domain-containing protein [Deltaproteobacteria bacterium]
MTITRRSPLTLASVLAGATLLLAGSADAAECFRITGWSSTSLVGAQALVAPTSCSVTPTGTAWLHVDMSYGSPPNDDLYLRINLSDSHMSGMTFSPLLVFSHYAANLPVVYTDLLVGNGNQLSSSVNPPTQGTIVAGAKVRLRHRNTGNCLYTGATNGDLVRNQACADSASQTFELVSAGSGTYRLRGVQANQCVYTLASSGATVHSWGCWNDPGMKFLLVPASGGFRLQNTEDNQCIFGNPTSGGAVHSWGCWNDPNMIYQVDIIQYPSALPPPDPDKPN